MQITSYNRLILVALSVFFSFATAQAQQSNTERTKTNINADWNYLENDTKSLSEVKIANNWTTIQLPHTWNSQDATDNEPG